MTTDLIISLILTELGRLPKFGDSPAPVFFTLFDEKLLKTSLALAAELRKAGIKVTNQLSADKLGKQFKYADRIGAKLALVLGPDEAEAKTITLKDLRSGEQQTVPQADLAETIKNMLVA